VVDKKNITTPDVVVYLYKVRAQNLLFSILIQLQEGGSGTELFKNASITNGACPKYVL